MAERFASVVTCMCTVTTLYSKLKEYPESDRNMLCMPHRTMRSPTLKSKDPTTRCQTLLSFDICRRELERLWLHLTNRILEDTDIFALVMG